MRSLDNMGNNFGGALAANCYPEGRNKMPHVLVQDGPEQVDERFTAIKSSWNEEFIIYGGYSSNPALNFKNKSGLAVVGRTDTTANLMQWLRSY